MATDVAMDDDMAIDFTVDEADPEIARLQAEAEAIYARSETTNNHDSTSNGVAMEGVVDAGPEEGELDSFAPAPSKIHVRGLDQLNTFDIEAWIKDHDQADLFRKVEWLDDTSANLVFDTEAAAEEALRALSAVEEDGLAATTDPRQMRAAKSTIAHPDVRLEIRQAVVADVKAPGAKDRSRFYLHHYEWDPDNPQNIRPDRKRKRHDGGYRTSKQRRRADEGHQPFDVDLYDDDTEAKARVSERRQSYSSGSDYSKRRKVRFGEDLLEGRNAGRLRDRSASPDGDGDGRYGFNYNQPRRRPARARSDTPPGIRSGQDNRGARDRLRKELFPSKQPTSALAGGSNEDEKSATTAGRRAGASEETRELFPDKFGATVHRRQDAQDLHPDEVARAIGKYTLDGAEEPQTYSSTGRRPGKGDLFEKHNYRTSGDGRDIFSRIGGGSVGESRYGRLESSENGAEEGPGFSIRGAGKADDVSGFNILGAGRDRAENPLVKELFPIKAGGSSERGKDLFDGKIKGRGAQRRRAEDLF